MDKYQVLLILIIYFIVVGITAVVFNVGNFSVPDQPGSALTFDTFSAVASFVLGGLLCNINGVPNEVRVIVALPFWCLLVYFIYLNVPSLPTIQKPNP